MQEGHTRGWLKLLALFTTVVAFFAIAANASASAKNGRVLILADTVSGGVIGGTSVEEHAAASLGYGVDVVSGATWDSMSTSQFAQYDALILGDPTCSGLYAAGAAIANRATWGAAVDGNKIFVGTDPVFHYRFTRSDIYQVTYNAVKFAADSASSGHTGIYAALSCYYHGTAPNTPVPLLDPFGSFSVTGVGCFNDAHIVATHPALAGLTDAILSNWSCSVHEAFDSWPVGFLPLAIARGNFSGAIDFPDGSRGTPYIIASGEGLRLISNIDLAPTSATNQVGETHTLFATVKENGTPVSGTTVTFTVVAGPNAGLTGTGVTDVNGVASWSYTSSLDGTDTIEASYTDSAGRLQPSNEVTKTWTKPREADIAVAKTGPATVLWGQDASYTITVTNNGPANATNVLVSDGFAGPGTFVSGSSPGGACSAIGSSISCPGFDLAAGDSATVTVVLHATMPGHLDDSAQASADQPDNTTGNNGAATETDVLAHDTAIVYTGDTTQDFNDAATLSGTLTDTSFGVPIAGEPVTLSLDGQSCSGTTNGSGNASCSITPNEAAGVYAAGASYAGSSAYNASSSGPASFTVTREETTTAYTGVTGAVVNGSTVTLSGVLKEDGSSPIAGRTLAFTLGSQSCSGTTGLSGAASCTITLAQPLGPATTAASFAGDGYYLPSSDSANVLLFALAPGGGAFVVGNVTATGSVTFWGSQWWKLNALTGGTAPAAFKGFASSPAAPACGGSWTTTTGNSPPPPAGPLPSYMGVIVASSVSQSGSTISGNVTHIVVVKTNAGYDANPGHPGTGTVVATYC